MISNEPLIYIDANTREIDIKGTLKDFVTVTDDHNAETIFFVIDRYFDNVDLYDKVCEIKYMNAIGELDFDTAVNIETFLEDGTEKLKFGWKISNKATKYYGAIKFQIMFYSLNYNEDGIVYNYVFNTKVTSIKIEEGLRHYSEINEDNYPDWAHEMYQQIHNVEAGLTEDEAREIFESIINEKQDVFIINVTIDGNTYISDKTYPEIINAIENNNTIIISVNSDTYIYPSRIWKTTDGNKNALCISAPYDDGTSFIIISEDGTIEVSELRFAEVDSLDQLWDNVGSVEQLLTNDKSSLVNAINEIVLKGTGSGGNIEVEQTYKPTSANAQSGKAVAEAVAQVDAKIGDVSKMNTPTQKVVVDAINHIVYQCEENLGEAKYRTDRLEGMIGQTERLQTENKSNLVAAINELVGNMGDIDTALENIIAMQNSYIGGDSV